MSDRHPIRVPLLVWWRLMRQLRARGNGVRESGAFLLGFRAGSGSRVVRRFVGYDEIDPDVSKTGIIRLDGRRMGELWRICRGHNLEVVADVHTHPTDVVDQSDSDQRHPMIAEAGHVALIVPRFASAGWVRPHSVGAYQYLGNRRWRDLASAGVRPGVRLTLF